MLLADGARADLFERLLAAGQLPEIQRHVIDRGGYRRASSTFTSTTGPAHLPFLTGCFPGTGNVPGYRWFDRAAYRPGLPAGPWCLRSYNGPEAFLYGKDLDPAIRTIYDIADDAINVFGVVTRGVKDGNSLCARVKSPVWLWAHYAHDYSSADRLAGRATAAAVDRRAEFAFVVFPGIDWQSHYVDAEGKGALASYRMVDRAVGRAAQALRARGDYDDTLIVVCSDHGHSPVGRHYDLPVRLEQDGGLRVAYHSWPVLRRDPQAVACVSGNGMCQVYVKAGGWRHEPSRDEIARLHPGLLEMLLAEPATDVLITRASEPGWLHVESRRGRARLSETPAGVEYVVDGADPLGLPELPPRMTAEEALRATFESDHPDALVQIAQLYRSSRAGDITVSAKPGYDFRQRYERPEHLSAHGSLHTAHMTTPLAMSAPPADGPLRTADVFATVLDFLGREAPAGIDGVSRLA
jgi:arylsulfatase A-like enzyme